MWETFTGWFSALFNYLRPQRADFEAVVRTQNEVISHQNGVIESMEQRISTMDWEFRQAMDRRDKEIERQVRRIDTLEKAEERCQKQLTAAVKQVTQLTGQVRALIAINEEQERIRRLKEDPAYQRDTIAQVKTLLDNEADRQTRVEEA